MANTTMPKLPLSPLSGSTSEEAIDLVQEVKEDVVADAEAEMEEQEDEADVSTSSSTTTLGEDAVEQGDGMGDAGQGAGVAGPTDSAAGSEFCSAQAQSPGEAVQEVQGARPSSPSASDEDSNPAPTALSTNSVGCGPLNPAISTPPSDTPAETLEAPPGLEPPSSVTLLKSSATTTTQCDEELLPLETALPDPSSRSPPNAFSSISLSHDDHELEAPSRTDKHHLEYPQYQYPMPQQPPQRFEPLPPSQLLSATISHALSLTPPSSPRFSFQSHPHGQQNGPYFNFKYKPSSRDVISGIAPHVFDERRRRRSMSRGRRNSAKWLDRNSYDGGGCGSGISGRPRASPLRRSVVISWDERSIYLEEATHSGIIASRVSIDIATGHERKDLSDDSLSSSSSGSSGESACSPTSLSSSEKGASKKLLGGSSGKTGPRWSRKFKLFKNIVSKMKRRDSPVHAVAAH